MVMVRDYGRGDLAQLRFGAGHWMGGDRYVRGDGTLAVFLTDSGLRETFEAVGFVSPGCPSGRMRNCGCIVWWCGNGCNRERSQRLKHVEGHRQEHHARFLDHQPRE
eukprot:g32498.t1